MPLQNRVDPFGNIVSVEARGSLMGNRGILHNDQRNIIRTYQHQAWVTCRLAFKNRHRKVMMPHNYTELFFLDEATAFSAGHRPCFECRRERYLEFKEHFVRANFEKAPDEVKVNEINKLMHKDRIRRQQKVIFSAKINELPQGTFFSLQKQPFLVYQSNIYLWSFNGYSPVNHPDPHQTVEVLTPKSTVKTFEHGFIPLANIDT